MGRKTSLVKIGTIDFKRGKYIKTLEIIKKANNTFGYYYTGIGEKVPTYYSSFEKLIISGVYFSIKELRIIFTMIKKEESK